MPQALQRGPNSAPSLASCTFLLPRQAALHSSGWGSRSPLPGPLLVFFSAKTHPSASTQTWCPACSPSSISARDACPPSVDMPRRCADGPFIALPHFNQKFLKDWPGIAHLGLQHLVQPDPEQVLYKHPLNWKQPCVASAPSVQPTSLGPSTAVSSQPQHMAATSVGQRKRGPVGLSSGSFSHFSQMFLIGCLPLSYLKNSRGVSLSDC